MHAARLRATTPRWQKSGANGACERPAQLRVVCGLRVRRRPRCALCALGRSRVARCAQFGGATASRVERCAQFGHGKPRTTNGKTRYAMSESTVVRGSWSRIHSCARSVGACSELCAVFNLKPTQLARWRIAPIRNRAQLPTTLNPARCPKSPDC